MPLNSDIPLETAPLSRPVSYEAFKDVYDMITEHLQKHPKGVMPYLLLNKRH